MDYATHFFMLAILTMKWDLIQGAGAPTKKEKRIGCWANYVPPAQGPTILNAPKLNLIKTTTPSYTANQTAWGSFNQTDSNSTCKAKLGNCCFFPFKYKNKIYEKCSRDRAFASITGLGLRNKLGWVQWAWCATYVNGSDNVLQAWDHCDPGCPGYEDLSSYNWRIYLIIAIVVGLFIGIVVVLIKKFGHNL